MSRLFFGDSLTAGENARFSFVDYSDFGGINLAVSGTTIGEYSIYPVDGNSLLSVIASHEDTIKFADEIYIEYGCNDVSAIMCGFATVQTVTVALVKAIDWIRQLNKKAPIYFLALGEEGSNVLKLFAKGQCDYLENDYFGAFNFSFPASIYSEVYSQIINNASNLCDIIYMFDDKTFKSEYISSDNMHPSTKGHRHIASLL